MKMKGFCLAGLVSPMLSIGLFYGYVCVPWLVFIFVLGVVVGLMLIAAVSHV